MKTIVKTSGLTVGILAVVILLGAASLFYRRREHVARDERRQIAEIDAATKKTRIEPRRSIISEESRGIAEQNAQPLNIESDAPRAAREGKRPRGGGETGTRRGNVGADSDTRNSGAELPWNSSADGNKSPIPAMPDADLAAAFRKAIEIGDSDMLSHCRSLLLAMGTRAAALLRPLVHSGTPAVEIEAARALIQIGGPEALAAAVGRTLTVPRDDKFYGAYVAALADSHSVALAEWLVSRLVEPEYQDARERIIDILDALRGTETVTALTEAVTEANEGSDVKDHVEALARRRDASETRLLADIMATSESSRLSAAAAAALANIGNGAACVALADLSEGNSPRATIAAAALASVRSAYGQETLLALAADPERASATRASAVRALAGHSGERVQTVLVNLAQRTDDPSLAVEIENTLRTLADNAAATSNSEDVVKHSGGEVWF